MKNLKAITIAVFTITFILLSCKKQESSENIRIYEAKNDFAKLKKVLDTQAEEILQTAMERKHIEVIDWAIDNGVDVDFLNRETKENLLLWAIKNKQNALFLKLLQHNAKIDYYYRQISIFDYVIKNADSEAILELSKREFPDYLMNKSIVNEYYSLMDKKENLQRCKDLLAIEKLKEKIKQDSDFWKRIVDSWNDETSLEIIDAVFGSSYTIENFNDVLISAIGCNNPSAVKFLLSYNSNIDFTFYDKFFETNLTPIDYALEVRQSLAYGARARGIDFDDDAGLKDSEEIIKMLESI